MIKTKSLKRSVDSKVLFNDINLELPSNQITGLLGANGAGKTSLFRAIDLFPASFIVLEGIFYIGGALMLGAQWPKLKPKVFGYHEVWHSLVVLAVAAHFLSLIHI